MFYVSFIKTKSRTFVKNHPVSLEQQFWKLSDPVIYPSQMLTLCLFSALDIIFEDKMFTN